MQCLLLLTICHCLPSLARNAILLHDLLRFCVQGAVLALFAAVHVASLAGLAPCMTTQHNTLCTAANREKKLVIPMRQADLGQATNSQEGGSKVCLFM